MEDSQSSSLVPSVETTEYGNRAGNIFILDTSPEMFVEHEEGSYFRQSLFVIEKILKEKLIYHKDDYVGLIFLGTEKKDEDNDNIFTMIPFARINLDGVRKVCNLIDKEDEELESYSSEKKYPIVEVLRYVQRLFGAVTITMPIRRVDLITCHDQLQDKQKAHQIRVIAQTFHSINVEFKIAGLGDDWNYDEFWKEVETLANGSDTMAVPTKLEELDFHILRSPRSIGKLQLRINNKPLLNVQLLPHAKRKPALSRVRVDRKTNAPLKSVTLQRPWQIDEDDEDMVELQFPISEVEGDLIKATTLGYRHIRMKPDEFNKWKDLMEKGIDILNFVPASDGEKPKVHLRPVWHVCLPPNAPKQEKKLFAALLLQCQAKNVAAICAAKVRSNVPCLRFKMWPNPEDGGFYFYKLPWTEEIRNLGKEFLKMKVDNTELDPIKLNTMKRVVKKLIIPYKPAVFPDPKELKRMMYILCLSLFSKADQPDFIDPTEPDIEQMRQILSKKGLLDTVFELFPERKAVLPKPRKTTVKRTPKDPPPGQAPPMKKAK